MLDDIRSFLQRNIHHDASLSFLLGRLEKTESMIHEGYWIPCLDLPRLISSGLNQNPRESHRLAMVSAFIYLGADLLDDLQDGELVVSSQTISGELIPSSQTISSADMTLLSATLLTAFPVLVLTELEADAETKVTMQKTIARFLLKMSEGQRQDLSLANKERASLDAVKQSIQAKSGEELALSCLLAAQGAKVSLTQQKLYEDLGRSLGTALQIVSDFHDLMWAPFSKDLKRGGRSLPIAFCLEKLQGGRRREFVELLRTAGEAPERLESLRRLLVDSGSLDYLVLVVEDLCQRSLETLESLELTAEVRDYLEDKIRSASLLPTEPNAFNHHERGTYEGTVTPHRAV